MSNDFDIEYKKALVSDKSNLDISRLNSIVGQDEFQKIVSELNCKSFMPGVRSDISKLDNYDDRYVKSGDFCANFHVHSLYSDGAYDVTTLLDSANSFAIKSENKFIVAFTDHDSVEGVKKIVDVIYDNFDKYKNLKIILGLEVSTVATEFLSQSKTLDIHTLVYCINPYDSNLNDFLNIKMEKKYSLACETLELLKKSLSEILIRYNIELSLGEAAKIHPLITKGQDEVSHPLKKYIYAKILYSYYVENNKNISEKLKQFGVDNKLLSYEKPVFMYKEMFNNDRYFYIYKDALEKYLNFVTENNFKFKLSPIPQMIIDDLIVAKKICENSHPTKEHSISAFSEFSKTVEFIAQQKYGLMSIAHPARINLKNISTDNVTFFDELFSVYKSAGKAKAYGYEKFYQSYKGEKHFAVLKDIDMCAAKYNLSFTGGIDTHGKDVSRRSPWQ